MKFPVGIVRKHDIRILSATRNKFQQWNQVKRVEERKQGKQITRNKSAKERVLALTLLQVQSSFNSASLELPRRYMS